MGEYIEKQAATKFIDDCLLREEKLQSVEKETLLAVKRWIDAVPPADVRPVVRGRWELAEDGWYCTACKLYPPFDCDPEEKGVPFCPWCGADMREETKE